MTNTRQLPSRIAEQHLSFFADVPTLMHCHHFNLFLDQTIDDALGPAQGTKLRTEAAQESAFVLLSAVTEALGASTPVERIALAQMVFSTMGHGRLQLDLTNAGGSASGSFLHYGFSWREKYGRDIKRRRPADAFAAGFAAAAAEVAHDLPLWTLEARETACVSMRAPGCSFEVGPRVDAKPADVPRVDKAATREVLTPVMDGDFEADIERIAVGLVEYLSGVESDERGLVQAFGVFVTVHLAGYYNRLSYSAVERLRDTNAPLVPILESLLRESGQVCVFHTFGGVLLSPEWEGLVGAPDGSVDAHVIGCAAIARSLGFGRWTVQELDPDQRLVLRTPVTYETPYCLIRHGRQSTPTSYFLQGAGLAIMELAHRIDWKGSPRLSDALYRRLFAAGAQWRVEQTADTAKGDPFCEVVVSRR
jgi:hypothetical protein